MTNATGRRANALPVALAIYSCVFSGVMRPAEASSPTRIPTSEKSRHQLQRPAFFVPSAASWSPAPKRFRQLQNTHLSLADRIPASRFASTSALGPVTIAPSHVATCVTSTATATTDVLSTSDIVIGTILAFLLAFGYSFLNGQSSSSSFISWRSQVSNDGVDSGSKEIQSNAEEEKVFDAENWKEISRPENYILYNSKIRGDQVKEDTNSGPSVNGSNANREQKWVVFALLILFIPIFSVEFWFALSRQFLCGGDPFTQSDWAQQLCSPYLAN